MLEMMTEPLQVEDLVGKQESVNQLVLPTNSNARALTAGRSSLVADFISLLQVGKHTFCFLCLDFKGWGRGFLQHVSLF